MIAYRGAKEIILASIPEAKFEAIWLPFCSLSLSAFKIKVIIFSFLSTLLSLVTAATSTTNIYGTSCIHSSTSELHSC